MGSRFARCTSGTNRDCGWLWHVIDSLASFPLACFSKARRLTPSDRQSWSIPAMIRPSVIESSLGQPGLPQPAPARAGTERFPARATGQLPRPEAARRSDQALVCLTPFANRAPVSCRRRTRHSLGWSLKTARRPPLEPITPLKARIIPINIALSRRAMEARR